MRKLLMLLILFCFFSPAKSQDLREREVPPPVKKQNKLSFPLAKKIFWYRENGQYIAEFMIEKVMYEACYDRSGNLLKTEKDVLANELPNAIIHYAKNINPGELIEGGQKITDNTGRIRWRIVLKGKEILFDEEGNFLR